MQESIKARPHGRDELNTARRDTKNRAKRRRAEFPPHDDRGKGRYIPNRDPENHARPDQHARGPEQPHDRQRGGRQHERAGCCYPRINLIGEPGQRNAAKKAGECAPSHAIRDALLAAGIVLEDTRDGTRWSRA